MRTVCKKGYFLLYIFYYTRYILHCKPYTVQCILYSVYCRVKSVVSGQGLSIQIQIQPGPACHGPQLQYTAIQGYSTLLYSDIVHYYTVHCNAQTIYTAYSEYIYCTKYHANSLMHCIQTLQWNELCIVSIQCTVYSIQCNVNTDMQKIS